ncbi:MAG: YigZ family protein [Corynebacterium sp.]|nr:YigZ family protein [Corynebacterium sp.]
MQQDFHRAYQRPKTGMEFRHDLEIKRSKFYCFIRQTTDEQHARDFIADVRGRFPDARHHCSAFIYHVADAVPVERSNDDGEPTGTAGRPMLDVLRGSGLLDISAVVVRYFGGIKLGAGGLVHAYSDAVAQCLPEIETVLRKRQDLFQVHFSHADAGRYAAELRNKNIMVVDTTYGQDVCVTLGIEPGTKDALQGTIDAIVADTVKLHEAGTQWLDIAQ